DLHTADLENLIVAAKGMSSTELGKLVDQGNSLDGIEKSHFFFGASKAGRKSHEFMSLIKETRGQERKEMLLVLANIEEEDLPAVIGRTARMDPDEQRIQFLAREKLELSGSKRQTLSSSYVHLSNHLSAGEFNDFLRAAGSASSQDDVDRLMEQMDSVDDRSSFLETAAGAGKELGNLLNLAERFIDEEKENFLGVAGKLKGESLKNFLGVAASRNSREELDEFVSFTDSMTGEEREKMLRASVDAAQQEVLTEFMDLTNQLGPARSLFLTVAEDAGGQLGNFIEATQNFITAEQNSFMAEAEKLDFHLMDLFEENPDTTYNLKNGEPSMKLVGTTSGGVFKFLENAFASGPLLGSFVKPYLS
ncbi:MAG: hypothetical protein GY860_23300, partial [Desulfobacteraceae bacterium]|nr:hypothetical protein [Desulfobacteraceae bacterium]